MMHTFQSRLSPAVKVSLLLMIAGLIPSMAFGQEPDLYRVKLPTGKQSSPLVEFDIQMTPKDAKPGQTVTLTIRGEVVEGWHIYPSVATDEDAMGLPTELVFESAELTPVGKAFSVDAIHRDAEWIEGEFSWTRQYRVNKDAGEYSGSGSITFQACDEIQCVPPKTLTFSLGTPAKKVKSNPTNPTKQAEGEIVLKTQPCKATRPKAQMLSLAAVMSRTPDVLKRKCTLKVEGQAIDIYLPAGKYSIENSSEDNTIFGNTSTYLSIDQNGDGLLEPMEAFPTNLPIRILDTMYRVTSIGEDGESISLAKDKGPLQGIVLNRRCPDFSFESVEGRTISNESILGKVTILDIWGVT